MEIPELFIGIKKGFVDDLNYKTQKISELESISGMNIEKIIELFKYGYVLKREDKQ